MTIHKYLLILTLIVSGCSNPPNAEKNNSGEATYNDVSELEAKEPPQLETGVDGFKEYKFGMTSSEVAKTPGCDHNYKFYTSYEAAENRIKGAKQALVDPIYLHEVERTEKRIQELIASLEKIKSEGGSALSTDEPRFGPKPTETEEVRVQRELADAKEYLVKAESNVKALQDSSQARYERSIKPLEEQFELLKNHDQSITDKWIANRNTFCVTELMGMEKTVTFGLNEAGKLNKITILLGAFDNQTYESIYKALSEKYSPSFNPSESQIALFNDGRLNRIAHAFEEGQISLEALNLVGFQNVKTSMVLVYADKAAASELNKQNEKGKVNVDEF